MVNAKIDLFVERSIYDVFLRASEHSFLICCGFPLPPSASVGANGGMLDFIEVIVPGVWSAALWALGASTGNKTDLT